MSREDNPQQVWVEVRRLTPTAEIPVYKNPGDAGLDLHADSLDNPVLLHPGQTRLIPTGIAVAIPPGYEGQVRSRSGLSLKQQLIVLNSPGTIDSGYRGEVGVILHNAGELPQTVKQGDRVAQLVISPVVRATLVEVDVLDDTARGTGGFGSSGV